MLDVREAVMPDHPKKYTEDQIRYHYAANNAFLERVVAAWASGNGADGTEGASQIEER